MSTKDDILSMMQGKKSSVPAATPMRSTTKDKILSIMPKVDNAPKANQYTPPDIPSHAAFPDYGALLAERAADKIKHNRNNPKLQAAVHGFNAPKTPIDEANDLLSLDNWSEYDRQEADRVLKRMQGNGWQNAMLSLTKDEAKYPDAGYNSKLAVESAKTGDYSQSQKNIETYNRLYSRVHSGATAVQTGLIKGTGALSLSEAAAAGLGKLTGDDKNGQVMNDQIDYLKDITERSGAEHPGLQQGAETAGSLMALIGTSELLGALGPAVEGLSAAGKIIKGALVGGASFGANSAVQNAGAAATGDISPESYLRDIGVSTLGGAVGSTASAFTGAGIAKILSKYGLQTPFAEFMRQTMSGTAFAAGDIAATYPLSENKPTGEEIVKQLGTAFLFSAITGAISTAQTTSVNKSRMQIAVQQMESDYKAMSSGTTKPEEIVAASDRMLKYSQDIRTTISQNYYAGQQEYIDRTLAALNAMDDIVKYHKGMAETGIVPPTLPGPEAPIATTEALTPAPIANVPTPVPTTPDAPYLEKAQVDIFHKAGLSQLPLSTIVTDGIVPTQAQLDAYDKGVAEATAKMVAENKKAATTAQKPPVATPAAVTQTPRQAAVERAATKLTAEKKKNGWYRTDEEEAADLKSNTTMYEKLADAIDNHDIARLVSALNSNNPNSIKLFADLTGNTGLKTQAQITEAIKALDPEAYTEWNDARNKKHDDAIAVEAAAAKQIEIGTLLKRRVQYNGAVYNYDGYITALISDGFNKFEQVKRGAITIGRLSKGNLYIDFDKKVERDYVADRITTNNPQEPLANPTQKEDNGGEKPKHEQIANALYGYISKGQSFSPDRLYEIADKAYGGTMASGAYSIKDAYDAMELAVNKHLEKLAKSMNGSVVTARSSVAALQDLVSKLPTQTKRTEEMEAYQQFSTPPNIAYLAAWAANVSASDKVLEPSAGIGGLAVFPKAWGAKVYVNELSPRRLEVIKSMGFDRTFNINAEQIHNLLPDDVQPSVVLMNPPFSSAAGRMTTKDTANAKRHIEQALERLSQGGRLVAIVGRGMSDDAPSFTEWWSRLKKEYNIRANIRIDGRNYSKYGTTFDIQLVVIDKNGPTTQTLTGGYNDLTQIPKVLEGIRNDRQRTEITASDGAEQNAAVTGRPTVDIGIVGNGALSDRGASGGAQPKSGIGTGNTQPDRKGAGVSAVNRVQPGKSVQSDDGNKGLGKESGVPSVKNPKSAVEPRGKADTSVGRSAVESDGERIQLDAKQPRDKLSDAQKVIENADNVYAEYTPKKLSIKGAQPHPAKLVESAAMAAVDPPDITYTPNIPQDIVKSGALSIAQLENIVYAGQAHTQMLKNGTRKGYFIGDGTGVGKGRQIAGIILDNFRQGRTKAIWISKNGSLLADARRDWIDLGGHKDDILELGNVKLTKPISHDKGILFSTYSTVKTDKPTGSRIEQIKAWLDPAFDGVIVFDESHNMSNSIATSGSRGKGKVAAMALAGIKLQESFPKARVVYASATGATKISDYAYLTRLGLWGEGTAFHNVNDFIEKIGSGGLAAMELVARDMKAMGAYMARSISYDDVTYDTLQHPLSPMQKEIYNTMSRAWQKVLQNIDKVLTLTNADKNSQAKAHAKSQFYGSMQRFYNQVITSMSMPSVIADIKKELAKDRSIVIQLVNTNQASMERSIEGMDDEQSLDDLDLTPSDTLIQYLEGSFPIYEYEEYEDDSGNVKSRIVKDGDDQPVISKSALQMRDGLIAEIKEMKVPDGPLEMLFDTFGTEQVAEITGRTRRIVTKKDDNGEPARVLENRTPTMAEADAQLFQDGKKRILVFSDAGGTGKSYHADKRAKNQQKRVHYLLQPGWNASNATQGFGRTHRSNQVSAPIFRLVTTDIMGQKRFTSTIARRLDQLGALTKGQRQAGSGVFSQKDNLESEIAKDTLAKFYRAIPVDTIQKMGVYDKLYDEFGAYKPDETVLRDMGKFLNRILALEVDEQNGIFSAFFSAYETAMDKAIEAGTVDMGLENVTADKIEVKDEISVRKYEGGAETKYVQLIASRKPEIMKYGQLENYSPNYKGLVRLENGEVRAVYQMADKTTERGDIVEQYRLQSPVLTTKSIYAKKTLDEKTTPVPKPDWMSAWNEQVGKAPEYVEQTLHLLTGTLLPIWNRLPSENNRVMRVITNDGRQYLGRLFKSDQIDDVLKIFNVGRTKTVYTPEDVHAKILNDGFTAILEADKQKLERRRVSGENRIELTGNNTWFAARYPGIIVEKINYMNRYFVPTNDAGIATIKRIIENNPIVELVKGKPEEDENGERYALNTDTSKQGIASADTSINSTKLPAVFSKVQFEPGTVNLDIGGGRFDNVTEHLAEIGVANYIYDPYNRTPEHNAIAAEKTEDGKSDTVTISNVLNVIKEQDARDIVLANAVDALKPDGTAYITIYEGDGSGDGKETSKGYQLNRKTMTFKDEVKRFFDDVVIKNGVIIAQSPKKPTRADKQASGGTRYALRPWGTRTANTPESNWGTPALTTSDTVKNVMSLANIMNKVRHDFGIAISTGHIRKAGASGAYLEKPGTIRTRIANDLPIVAHELGHHLDKQHGLSDVGKAEQQELIGFIPDETKKLYKDKELPGEGVAEFVRRYLSDRTQVEEDYPLFYHAFTKKLSNEELTLLDGIADEINNYLTADLSTTAAAAVAMPGDRIDFRSNKEKVTEKADVVYQAMVDINHAVKMFGNFTDNNHPYILATNAAYADNVASANIMYNLSDIDGKIVGPGLKQALFGVNIRNKVEFRDFNEYLIVCHGPERLKEGMRVYADDRKNKADFMNFEKARLENKYPQFKKVAEQIYAYQQQVLKTWAVSTGIISPETAEKWAKRWQYYVPFNRLVEKSSTGSRAKRGFANQSSPYKKARGSGLDIVAPVLSIARNSAKLIQAAIRNDVMKNITASAAATEGSGAFLEKVPAPIKATTYDAKALKQKLKTELMDKLGQYEDDDDGLIDTAFSVVNETVDDLLIQYGRGKAFGDVVTVMRSGKPEFWKINDPMLLESVTSMSPARLPGILEAYGRITRFMVSNITGNNIVWSIFSNMPRDFATFMTYSENKNPITIFGNILNSYWQTIKTAAGSQKIDPYYLEYLAMGGGGHDSFLTADRDNSIRAVNNLLANDKLKYINPLEWIETISDAIEGGPRFAYYRMLRKQNYSTADAFYKAKDITVNFRKGGPVSRQINKVVPFSSAAIQSLDRFARWTTGADVPKEVRKKVVAGRWAWYILSGVILAGAQVLWARSKDEKGYKQLSAYVKNNYWNIPLGDSKFFSIPKPRELAVLTTTFERLFEVALLGNNKAFNHFDEYLTAQLLPPVVSGVAEAGINAFQGNAEGVTAGMSEALGDLGIAGTMIAMLANRDFRGNPIVSQSMMLLEPRAQFNNRTSSISKVIGNAFNMSPLMIDYLFNATLGGFWKVTKAATPSDGEVKDVLGISASYIKDSRYSTDVVNDFYDQRNKADQMKRTYSDNAEYKITANDYDDLAAFYSRYNALSKGSAETLINLQTRQSVIDIIEQFMSDQETGNTTAAKRNLDKLAASVMSTTFYPQVMAEQLIIGEGSEKKTYPLSAAQYVEYQTTYLKFYWEEVGKKLRKNYKTDADKVKGVASGKATALEEVKKYMAQKLGVKY